ncbi:uncharacterized protein BO96DRAFT_348213, partial [Aspergillus niger CBS 101883]
RVNPSLINESSRPLRREVQKLCTTHQQTIFLKQGNIPGQTILYLPLIAMLGIPTRPMMVLDANKVPESNLSMEHHPDVQHGCLAKAGPKHGGLSMQIFHKNPQVDICTTTTDEQTAQSQVSASRSPATMADFRRAIRQFRVAGCRGGQAARDPLCLRARLGFSFGYASLRRYRALLRWVVVIEERTEAGCAVCLNVAEETGLATDKEAQILHIQPVDMIKL